MAHIPSRKRSLKDVEDPSPDQFERNSKSGKRKWQPSDRGRNPAHMEHFISKIWAVGLTDDGCFPTLVRLESVSCETFECKKRERPKVLVHDHPSRDVNKTSPSSTKSPWLFIAEKIQQDLHTSFQDVMNEMGSQKFGEVKPSFVARIGKVYFHGSPSISLDTIWKSLVAENSSQNKVKKTFCTNVPDVYVEAVERMLVPKTRFGNVSRKEHYNVKVLDKLGATISCKCSPTEDGGKLELHKVESITARHLIADILCLDKDFDLRLMLATRKTFGKLHDDVDRAVRELIKSAKIDPNAKGGLSWPPGKESFGDRFSVSAVWHTKFKVFKGPTMTVKLRDADRFDFKSSTVQVTKEVIVKMTEIARQLRDGGAESGAVDEMLQETLKFLWDQLLNHDCSSM
ncbi:uncharacterized protein LOC131246853 [Magnolia sinica]|uniref:uncharacterized protein LOC131246853 n=1 Tax=Magnolia sinica TaxID=86752 RepID=UPI00265AF4DC|nr:uncharacterized protein LOC131246853 [Magnolia sinica]XP_058103283.1 uncharacterized protein LOC131246853 [Magnolia sinica]XP_058103284.1 uncharacterized protein LOC131246853 [Magnolia sinica]